MKIKNVVFSGFAAAIFAGVCGAANAASVELISKPYADTNLQAKLTAGSNIAIDSQTNTISATGLATTTYVDEELAKKQNELQLGENLQWVDGKLDTKGIATADGLAELENKVNNAAQKSDVDAALALKADKTEIPTLDGLATSEELNTLRTTLEASIAEKQQKGEYLVAADLKTLEDAVEALQSGKADASTVETIQETINNLGNTYATKADMTAADSALQAAIEAVDAKIPSLDGYAKTADLAAVATSGQYADLEGKPDIPSIEGLATSEELNTLRTTLEASIAEKQQKGEYLVAADLKTLEDAVDALQSGKADASTVETIQETINNLGNTYATKEDMTAADQALQAAIDNMDLSAYAKVADVYSKTDADAKFLIMRDANALGANLQWNEAGKLDTKGIATADGLKELEDKVADAVTNTELEAKGYQTQTDVETLISGKADSTTVASDIATALQTAKDYADANDADTIYDDTALAGRVKTLEDAGYQTATEVGGAITTATADLATKSEVNAVSTSLGEYKTSNDAAVASKANSADVYTKSEVDAAIAAIEEYDDTALAARVSANESAIATNTSGVEANAGAIEALQNAGYVSGVKTAGSYLVNFDAEGNASYAAVEILDDKGNPIDLTLGAVK